MTQVTFPRFAYAMIQFLGVLKEAFLQEAYQQLYENPEAFYKRFPSVPNNFFTNFK